ncbi:hypothetical protein DRN58_09745 [Thermococci archaeon]|nr:MAG: hypothetical protein DRN58_09745 [Thermococci archaeon]
MGFLNYCFKRYCLPLKTPLTISCKTTVEMGVYKIYKKVDIGEGSGEAVSTPCYCDIPGAIEFFRKVYPKELFQDLVFWGEIYYGFEKVIGT